MIDLWCRIEYLYRLTRILEVKIFDLSSPMWRLLLGLLHFVFVLSVLCRHLLCGLLKWPSRLGTDTCGLLRRILWNCPTGYGRCRHLNRLRRLILWIHASIARLYRSRVLHITLEPMDFSSSWASDPHPIERFQGLYTYAKQPDPTFHNCNKPS